MDLPKRVVIREEGPQTHLSKRGTPTMGGALILLSVLVPTMLWADVRNVFVLDSKFIGTDIGALMGGAIVTERIFNIHGVGYQLYQGILRQNTQTVVGFVTVLVLVFLAANRLVDLLYAVLDPRIRYA